MDWEEKCATTSPHKSLVDSKSHYAHPPVSPSSDVCPSDVELGGESAYVTPAKPGGAKHHQKTREGVCHSIKRNLQIVLDRLPSDSKLHQLSVDAVTRE